jgi:predicted ATPase/DNA-binding SARP family transcriptional activator
VRVDVLGPLRLTVGDDVIDVPGPKRRALLALLTMAEGRAVSTENLLEALWPAELPESARATLQSHVSRLRRHLGPAASRLEEVSGAYRLRVDGPADGTDVARVRALLATAKGADAARALHVLAEARALWRGAALAEFDETGPLTAWAVTLDALRRTVDEAYAAAALAAGDTGDAVDVASTLAAEDPLSEAAALLLMRALDAAGRSADALRVGHDHRRRLAAETGLDPSPAVGELEAAIAGRTSTRPPLLPRPASGLRGRDSELAAVQRLLAHERLVTVLGPGGVGKTALAAEVGARADRACALLLAPVTDAASIPQVLAAALDLRVVHGDVLSACTALLAAGPQLLVVDNCEHLQPDVRDVVAALLGACPPLTVLATSREPLGLAAEQRYRLAPLPVTVPHDIAEIGRSPAVAVFVDCARRIQPGFSPDSDDLRLIGDIVRRLDGVPLAIELAAARLSSLGLADLYDRLDRSLDLLGGGQSVTLRQTIEWSYDLLPDHEQRLFRHLAVFPDGFDLATAELVAADLGLAADPAAAVAHLVDASMVDLIGGVDARYRMLDTIRSFGTDRLRTEGENQAATEGFLHWALHLASWFDQTIDTDDESQADARLRREIANLRAAWRLVREHGRLDDAVRIVVAFGDASSWRDVTEMWDWALELADDPLTEAHPDAASVVGVAAGCAWTRGELDRAARLARRGLELGGDGAWRCQAALALVALSRGDLTTAAVHSTEAAEHATRPDQSLGIAALAHAYDRHIDTATAVNDRLGAVAVSPTLNGFRSYVAGEIDALAGSTERAQEHYERAIALSRESGATFLESIAAVGLHTLRANAGQIEQALDGYRDLLEYWTRTGGWIQQWTTLRNLARLLRRLGDEETAAFLDAAADHAPDAPPVPNPSDPPHTVGIPADRMATIVANAATASRHDVLDFARRALDRHRRKTNADQASRGAANRHGPPSAATRPQP